MNSQETVQTLLDLVQRGDFDRAKTLLSDDFQFKGMIHRPINGKTWLRMSASLKMAFAGLNYHFKVDSANGDVVNSSSQMSGNNRGAFDLTGLRMGVISATNKDFSTVRENHTITVKDEKVSSWVVEPTEGAGLMAILKQLDVKLSKT
ncbi:MAG TPA: ester cyclase [Anaerolineales bacterium]|nr:ester cyclase [Anaerolineales bacterium]